MEVDQIYIYKPKTPSKFYGLESKIISNNSDTLHTIKFLKHEGVCYAYTSELIPKVQLILDML
jgi:hypothetical protein